MVKPLYYISLYYDRHRVTGANKRFDEIGERLLQLYPGKCVIITQQGHRPAWCPEAQFIGIRPYRDSLSRLRSWLQLSATLLRLPPGIVHSDFQPAPPLLGLRHKRLQLIHDLRNWTEFRRGGLGPITTGFQRQQLRSADAVVTVSQFSKRDILAKCDMAPEKVIVAYNGIAETYHPDNNLERDIDICFVGTYEPRKNHLALLKAIERLPTAQRVVLIGRDLGLLPAVKEYIANSSSLSQRQIELIESVDEAEMVRTYQRTKVFVSPALLEGFGMPLIEAAACGAQVACSDIEVFREICGDAASYFDPNDIDDMTATIDAALRADSPSRMDVDRFRWTHITQELIAAITRQFRDQPLAAGEVPARD